MNPHNSPVVDLEEHSKLIFKRLKPIYSHKTSDLNTKLRENLGASVEKKMKNLFSNEVLSRVHP